MILAWTIFSGGGFGEMLSQWEQAGFFSYLLPFLLIFALVFGILTRIKIFPDNKAITSIISLAVGLMALQFDFVSRFFSEVFPRLGIGLAVILVIMILVGLFIDPDNKGMMIGMLVVGVIITILVLINSGLVMGDSISYWIRNNWTTLFGIAVFLAVIGIIIGASNPTPGPASNSLFAQMLRQQPK